MKYFLDVHESYYTRTFPPSGKEYGTFNYVLITCVEKGDVLEVTARRNKETKTFTLKPKHKHKCFGLVFNIRDANDESNIRWFKKSTLDSNILADYYELIDPNTDTSSLRSRNLDTYFDPHSHMDPDVLKEYLQGEDRPNHDAPEEVIDEDIDDDLALAEYVLLFKVDATWPKSSDDLKVRYEWCYPLCLSKKPFFQFFEDLFVMEGFDRLHNLITLKLNRGKGDEFVNVKLNEEFKIDFDYYSMEGNDDSYRIGTASFMLLQLKSLANTLSGKLVFHNKYVDGGKIVMDEEVSLDTIVDTIEDGPTIQNAASDDCGVFAIDEGSNLIILYGLRQQDDEKVAEYYFPVWFDRTYEEVVTFNQKEGNFELVNTVRYEKE